MKPSLPIRAILPISSTFGCYVHIKGLSMYMFNSLPKLGDLRYDGSLGLNEVGSYPAAVSQQVVLINFSLNLTLVQISWGQKQPTVVLRTCNQCMC
eukprot:871322-Amphidinium_carterae.1